MIGPLDYIFGTANISVGKEDAEKVLNLLHANMFFSKKTPNKKGEYFSFEISLFKLGKVLDLLDKFGVKVYIIKRKGLPHLLCRYKKRYGIFVGILLFCSILWLSEYVVWEIDFSGNENISDIDVEQQLMEVGFGVGSYIPNIDFYALCNEFLIYTDDFSFISINMEGTKAHVELRERKKRDETVEYEASNLVAKYSGVVESMTVYSGQTVIEKESVVKEGDLLVSGFLEKEFGFDIVRSSGSVYAYVTREFVVDIPFENDVKVYKDKSQYKTDINFFGRNFNIYSNIDDTISEYDTVVDRERVVLFDRVKLPLICTKTSLHEYELQTVKIDEQDARKQAELQMSKLLANELSDCEVLERKTTEEITDEKYKLVCSIYCLADIAQEKEIILK